MYRRRQPLAIGLTPPPPLDAFALDLLWQADGLHLIPAGYDRIGEDVAASHAVRRCVK